MTDLLTTQQVADRLGLHPGHVRRLATSLGIGQRIGRDWLFSPDDVARLQSRRQVRGPVPRATIPNDPTTSQWSNKRCFERDGRLYVVAEYSSGDGVGVWESADNGTTWHAPSQATLEALISYMPGPRARKEGRKRGND